MHRSLLQIDSFLPHNGDQKRVNKILADLTATPKKISCVFFYDAIGSKLFKEITHLPEYYLTRTEMTLLQEAASQIGHKFRNVDVVEFGSGDCTKISIFLDTIPMELIDSVCYIPVDVSSAAVETSAHILQKKFPGIRIHGFVADFLSQLDVIPHEANKIFCFLGSTIGNFSLEQALQFLGDLSSIMMSDDLLLLGFDMVKSKAILEKAYNDSQLVTERFNKNILKVVNSHIGSDFDTDMFEHIAFFNERFSRIEMHLKAIMDLEVSSPYLSSPLVIKKGETIHTENSYKYTNEDIKWLASGADLDIQTVFTDENNWFSLVQLKKVGRFS